MKFQWKQSLYALIAALIWGTAFVAQSSGSAVLEPMTFTTFRGLIGAVVLGLFLLIRRGVRKGKGDWQPLSRALIKKTLVGGVLIGLALTAAANLQQFGITTSGAGKGAFITSMYIIFVPICSVFLRKKVPPLAFIATFVALFGLYLLCVKDGFTVETGDLALLGCALVFTAHVLLIDYYTKDCDPVHLSFLQVLVTGVLSGIGALIFEHPDPAKILQCALPLLYVGVFSSGLAYTLQNLAQKGSNPTVISLIFSLESVFGIGAEMIFFPGTVHTAREYWGCAIVLIAVIVSQIPLPHRKKGEKHGAPAN